MSVRSALVDRAYRLRKQPDRRRVEGTTIYAQVESEPVRARLTLNAAQERPEDGRVMTEPAPTLIVLRRDERGEPLDWRQSDRVRVVSRELGEAVYEVSGEPQPMRKRRSILGYQLPVRRVEEAESRRVG